MRVHPVVKRNGEIVAFEIENLSIGIRTIAELLEAEEDVTAVTPRRMFAREQSPLMRFTFAGQNFIVEEPLGDSSRYWVGPENPAEFVGSARALVRAFASYEPPAWRAALAAILTPFARRRRDVATLFIVAPAATMLMTLAIAACTGKRDGELGELLPRSALLHDALGCYTIEPAADLRSRWSAMLDSLHIASMASIVVDSSIFVSERRGARLLEVDRSDTQPAIDIWRADSLSASIRWYFYRVRQAMVIDLEPVDGDHYAGDVWWWSDALPAPERIGSVRARRVPCVPKRP